MNLSRSNEKRCGDGFERASFPNASRRGSVPPRSIDSPNTSSGDVAGWRNPAQAFPTARPQKITPKQAAILGTKPAAQLTAEQQLLLDQLSAKCPDLLGLRKLVGDFREVLRCGEGQSLLVWMKNAKHSGIGPVARFAVGLEKDFSAVLAAVETPWSNGQVEGQINRLKTLKRQMFGRAGFPLLRARVLPYAPFDFTPVSQPP